MAKRGSKNDNTKKTKTVKKTKGKDKNSNDVNAKYSKKSLHQHILDIPDTYVGDIRVSRNQMFVYNPMYIEKSDELYEKEDATSQLVSKIVDYVGGLYKIFDEILVNATDHTVRDKKCKTIKIYIDKSTGIIRVWNDGTGIPVGYHNEAEVFAPHMIFGQLLTSGNYDQKGKMVGGKNGYGAKLANIFSLSFTIRTIGETGVFNDVKSKKVLYEQTFENNMKVIGVPTMNGIPIDLNDPKVKKQIVDNGVLSIVDTEISQKTKTYTEFEFLPDYERFGMSGLTSDMYDLLIRRCYDAAACTADKGVKVYINDDLVKCKSFKDYVKMFYTPEQTIKIVHEKVNSRWEIAVAFVKEGLEMDHKCVSFVNGISTFQGGNHEAHVINNIIKKTIACINSDPKYKDLKIKPHFVKEYLMFYVNAKIEDPSFGSQTKELMTSKLSDWCSHKVQCEDMRCNFSDEFIQNLCKTGLKNAVVSTAEHKESEELKQSDGKRTNKINGIEKLDDAKFANKKPDKCTLILTEGDSAKAYALNGLSVIGSDYYGVYPVGGKVLNVRKATVKQIVRSEEFKNIKNIIGLKQGIKYTSVKQLRYGSIVILTDQDVDGSHIKGLIINMFEHFWPELLRIDGFLKSFNTYVVKAWKKTDKKKKNAISFYTTDEFEEWKKTVDIKKYESRYYKGLGTSTPAEAKEAFENYDDAIVNFKWENYANDTVDTDNSSDDDSDNSSDNDSNDNKSTDTDGSLSSDKDYVKHVSSKSHKSIELAFGKNADLRKYWVSNFDINNAVQYSKDMSEIEYSKFINEDLVLYSLEANSRMIPSCIDGLKPSQRMIQYAMHKRGRDKSSLKVSQLSGYVSENTDYHHGEASLEGAIKGMARNYPGSNNINTLIPEGNFGYRNLGGKDAASSRYIFTKLDKISNYIYRIEDDNILDYNELDGKTVEPKNFEPIIPMVLINGASGIGMGYSTSIPSHNPKDVINNLIRLIDDKEPLNMMPWFNGFKNNDEIEQCRKKNGDIIPNSYMIKGLYTVKGSTVHITEIPVQYNLSAYKSEINKLVSQSKDDNKKVKSVDVAANNNYMDMTVTFKGTELQKLFNSGKIAKFLKLHQRVSYNNMHLFTAEGKLEKYDTTNDILRAFFEHRFKIYEVRREYKLAELKNIRDINRYKIKYIKEIKAKTIIVTDHNTESLKKLLEKKKYPVFSADHESTDKSYKYLISMQIGSLTTDKIEELENKVRLCEIEYDDYLNTSVRDIWKRELKELIKAYNVWLKEWDEYNEIYLNTDEDKFAKKGKKGKKNTKSTKPKK